MSTISASSIDKKIISGLSTGVISTYIFNPIDKALYEMVRDKKQLFDKSIWRQPYKGVQQALGGRVISYGVCFSLYDICKNEFKLNTCTSSIITGCSSSIITSPMTVTKMYNWNQEQSKSLYTLSHNLYKTYGLTAFVRGLHCTMLRDSIFAVTFYGLSSKFNKQRCLTNDVLYGSIATLVSSPINYVRNMSYFNFNKKIKVSDVLKDLKNDIKYKNYNELFIKKLNCGWGTLRVGLGMATSKKIYEIISDNFKKGNKNHIKID
jgi:hypothetical protein